MSSTEEEICCKLFDLRKWIPEFLLDDTKRAALCFRESLLVCLKNGFATGTKPVGGYCILAESIGPEARELLVHVQSSMSIDGHFGGSKVICSVTEKFHCLEEKRTEFVYKDDGLHEKNIFIGMEDDRYHVTLNQVCPCEEHTESKELFFCCNGKFLSEGVNVLLMRYLAIINYEGSLSLEGITIDGDITMCTYNCIGTEKMELDGHYLNVYTIERKIYKEDESLQDIRTYMTPHGRILKHDWLDVPYILTINPLADPNATNKTTTLESSLRDRWMEDIEMVSKYLDMKSDKTTEQMEYLEDHPQIKQLIADYVQTLLVVKPINVIDFTIQHFKAFAKEPKTWETESEENFDNDLQLQLAQEKNKIVCDVCGFCINCTKMEESTSSSSTGDSFEMIEHSRCTSCASQGSSVRCFEEEARKTTPNLSTSTNSEIDTRGLLMKLKETCEQRISRNSSETEECCSKSP